MPPLYKSRTPEVKLVNHELNHDLRGVIKAADLNGAEKKKPEWQLGQNHSIIKYARPGDKTPATC